MKPAIRPATYVFLTLIAITGVWLTFSQVQATVRYQDDPRNTRSAIPLDGPRGRLVTSDGVVLAEDADDGRSYPQGSAYAHLVGYDADGTVTGLEATRRRDLLSRDDGSLSSMLLQLTGTDLGPPDVHLTVVDSIQQTALRALDGRTGAVVALDPATGAVLAYVSLPSFDPNPVAGGEVDPEAIDSAAALDRVAHRLLPPGSTFKTIVAAAALGRGDAAEALLPDSASYQPPGGGLPIGNATPGPCGNGSEIDLTSAFAVSCNTAFAALAVDLGGEALVGWAEQLGFNTPVPWELASTPGQIPPGTELDADPPALAQTGIGERDARATPLLMAQIASAIANNGVSMAPYVVDALVSPSGSTIATTSPRRLGRVLPVDVAEDLASMMREVVVRGTGTAAAVQGIDVSGKTGTAEGGGGPHAWFIGFAIDDDGEAIAVAVVVESAGSGGGVAAPIAARVIEEWMRSSE